MRKAISLLLLIPVVSGCSLLRTLLPTPKGIRLLGLTLSNLSEGGEAESAKALELPL